MTVIDLLGNPENNRVPEDSDEENERQVGIPPEVDGEGDEGVNDDDLEIEREEELEQNEEDQDNMGQNGVDENYVHRDEDMVIDQDEVVGQGDGLGKEHMEIDEAQATQANKSVESLVSEHYCFI